MPEHRLQLTIVEATGDATKPVTVEKLNRRQLTSRVRGLLRPYRGWLTLVLVAIGLQIATSLVIPWPLKGIGALQILQDVDVKVPASKHAKLQGKTLLADGKRAIVGSINLWPGSFDSRQELAIKTAHGRGHVVNRLRKIVEHDWWRSHRLDLSDEAFIDDLHKREGGSAENLPLGKRHDE